MLPFTSTPSPLFRRWLLLAVASLAFAGIFSFLLVASRTPGIQAFFAEHDVFHTALVVHVNLSVLVWMLTTGCMLWSMVTAPAFRFLSTSAFYCMATGSIFLTISGFIPHSQPLMNNYVPMLQNLPFCIAIALIATATFLQVVGTLLSYKYFLQAFYNRTFFPCGLFIAALITLLSLIAFSLSYQQLIASSSAPLFGLEQWYETLFWGGGHLLQYTYTTLLLIVWCALCMHAVPSSPLPFSYLFSICFLQLVITAPALVSYYFYPADSFEHIQFFTDHMRYGGGLVPVLGGMWCLRVLTKYRPVISKLALHTLSTSLALFFMGGVLALMISGVTVTIPAHYHGSIVGITLSFMGLIYVITGHWFPGALPKRLAILQLYLYAIGQFLHISGLAWSGHYGISRKTPGAVLSLEAKLGMGLMGLGGLLAILGGLLFVGIIAKTFLSKR